MKEITVDKGDVFSIDIVMTTGEGKPKLTDKRTTVFKRDLEVCMHNQRPKVKQPVDQTRDRSPDMSSPH